MGLHSNHLNPSSEAFRISRQSDIYVDKSGLIAELNEFVWTNDRFICVTRPRGFGKTMAAQMVAAYYCASYDSHDLFSGLEIESDPSFEKYMNNYNVLMLDMTEFLSEARSESFAQEYQSEAASLFGRLDFLVSKVVRDELLETMPDFPISIDDSILMIMHKAQDLTGRPFVIVIDEWDCIFRGMKRDRKSESEYLSFLRYFLKDKTYVALAYMTGIMPCSYREELGMFYEYPASDPCKFGQYLGFTQEETRSLCQSHDMPFGEMSEWYGGYLAEGVGPVFNPFSVAMACMNQECRPYWAQGESSRGLRRFIGMNHEGLENAVDRLIAGERVRVDTGTFQNTMATLNSGDDVLTLLIHLGYLAFDEERNEAFIPNREMALEFAKAMNRRASGNR